MSLRSELYVGSVFHRRFAPRAHQFRYRLFWLLADLDELDVLGSKLTLLSHNRANLFSLNDRDHGDGGGASLRAQADALLQTAGVDLQGGQIRLLCTPRAFGYAFNPLSVYFCHGADGTLAALIYQVHNTFGERHSYVLPAAKGGRDIRQSCEKTFFVSPFLPMGLRYAFHVSTSADNLAVSIKASGPDGPALWAALGGRRRALTDGALLRAALAIPAIGVKTMLAIHWEALRLLAKGVPFLGRKGA